ncbi:NF-kappa-B inhibitor-like protein 1 [Mytilus galloprovincialis]|uniref:NF-kappa-B inhibitor-like protein 1 n=1 Tax=Mytilus galloprovincialis TaxID=29158 RepID=A0A8B6CZQ7_MYTGA|nr:NF-kappa-B inhibitor-like protein 1 [Mytilus galloprovincialis]
MGKDVTEKLKKYIKDDRPGKFKSYVRKHRVDVCEIRLDKDQSLLHYSCKYGQDVIFRYLITKDIDVTLQDSNGNTALHLALKRALKSTANTVYTSISLPLIEKCPSLLEVKNEDGISCRSLLDNLVKKKQHYEQEDQPSFYKSEDENEADDWQDKLADELRNEHDDFSGRYHSDKDEDSYAEGYDDWADRLRHEYHLKHRYGAHQPKKQRETTSSSQSKKQKDSKENLEDIRKKMRQKYEENQKRDRENRLLLKSKNYLKNITSIELMSNEGEIKFNDVPWPFNSDVKEIKNVMFHSALSSCDKYKKRLREEQVRWHPDKFLQKHGKKLYEKDKNKIMERVKEISQELNRLTALF